MIYATVLSEEALEPELRALRFETRRVVNGEDELYSPPSCFGAVQELTIRALPEGSYRILGSLVRYFSIEAKP